MYKRLVKPRSTSFFLLGIRGVGKSTWFRQVLPDAVLIDLLDEVMYHDLLVDIGLFRNLVSKSKRGDWVVVDEIQRIPGLLNKVHRLIEDQGIRFALNGSSERKLKMASTNPLVGRASVVSMFPFVPDELGEDLNLETVLQFGSIPVVWNSVNRRHRLLVTG